MMLEVTYLIQKHLNPLPLSCQMKVTFEFSPSNFKLMEMEKCIVSLVTNDHNIGSKHK